MFKKTEITKKKLEKTKTNKAFQLYYKVELTVLSKTITPPVKSVNAGKLATTRVIDPIATVAGVCIRKN